MATRCFFSGECELLVNSWATIHSEGEASRDTVALHRQIGAEGKEHEYLTEQPTTFHKVPQKSTEIMFWLSYDSSLISIFFLPSYVHPNHPFAQPDRTWTGSDLCYPPCP